MNNYYTHFANKADHKDLLLHFLVSETTLHHQLSVDNAGRIGELDRFTIEFLIALNNNRLVFEVGKFPVTERERVHAFDRSIALNAQQHINRHLVLEGNSLVHLPAKDKRA